MIPVYNCSAYLPETLTSVLQQDPGEVIMQIAVVDDCSTDADVENIVGQIGRGRVEYFRQQHNVGSLRNFQSCIEQAKGTYVHLLHGDDRVRPGFYTRFAQFFDRHHGIGAAFCRYAYMDEKGKTEFDAAQEAGAEGVLDDWILRIGERQRIQYVSMVVRRAVYEDLGAFYGVEYGEDWEMWVRIASRYRVGYIPEVLAEYRRHFSSISGNAFLTARNMTELRIVMDRIRQYLPVHLRHEIIGRGKRFYAHYALRVANMLWSRLKHRPGAVAQARAAWSMWKDASLAFKIFKLYTRMMLGL